MSDHTLHPYHYYRDSDVAEVAARDPHRLVLVRCGAFRALLPIGQLPGFLRVITGEETTYIRDISNPVRR